MKYLASIFISSCSVLVSASEHFSTATSMVTSIICDCAHPVAVSSPRKAVPSSTYGDLLHARADHYAQFPSRAPSDQAVPAEFKKLQTMKPLPLAFCNRLAAASSTPVTLMHPIFGRFVDECNTHTPTKDDNDFIANLSKCMSGFFEDERKRRDSFINLFREYGVELLPADIISTTYRTDGHATQNGYMYCLSEAKLELAAGSAEPYFQSILYYRASCKSGREGDSISVLPCFLIFYCGSRYF